jgi:hypothetical protein
MTIVMVGADATLTLASSAGPRMRSVDARLMVVGISNGAPGVSAVAPRRLPAVLGCNTDAIVGTSIADAAPIPSRFHYGLRYVCPASVVSSESVTLYNDRGRRVDRPVSCSPAAVACAAGRDYHPRLDTYTPTYRPRFSAVNVITAPRTTWAVADLYTLRHCIGFGTPVLRCVAEGKFVVPDHRCDLTHFAVTRSPGPYVLFPSSSRPLAPFVDRSRQLSRLYCVRVPYRRGRVRSGRPRPPPREGARAPGRVHA